MTLFLWVFLTAFILIGLAMIGALLSCLAGAPKYGSAMPKA